MIVRLLLSLAAVLAVTAAGAGGATRPVVVIDPGHDLRANLQTEPIGPGSATRKIKDGGGTRGVVSGTTEAELNLAISLRLRTLLERAGVRVVMTRSRTAGHEHRQRRPRRDREPGRRGAVPPDPCRRRPVLGGAGDAHAVSGAPGRLDGRHLRPSRTAARTVQRELVAALGFPDRGLQERSDFTGFNWADVPAILVEMGFMTNATEDRALATAAYRERAARGLCRGVMRVLGRPASPC